MKAQLLSEIRVPLTVPVPVAGADGKPATRDSVVIKRPKVRHAKLLAVAIGADLVRLVFSDDALGPDGKLQVDYGQVVADLAATLMSQDRLDALTAIVGDLCGEPPAFIDDVDLIDLVAIGRAFLGFFPSLQSFAPTISLPN